MPSDLNRRPRIFLLSPANLAGIRAGYLLGSNTRSDLASRLRHDGLPLGELFSFVSGLYFRGKLAYALAFAAPPGEVSGTFVITASVGLLVPETIVTLDLLEQLAGNGINADDHRYRAPLDRDCQRLAEKLGQASDVVLLGSIATQKYVVPLLEVFRERLLFPTEFVGRGDMSRGGLMLRSVASGQELAYMPVINAPRHGARPPKLLPIRSKSLGPRKDATR